MTQDAFHAWTTFLTAAVYTVLALGAAAAVIGGLAWAAAEIRRSYSTRGRRR